MQKVPLNKFKIGDRVTIYGFYESNDKITAMEFRNIDKIWCYQVGNSSWWNESSLKLIKEK